MQASDSTTTPRRTVYAGYEGKPDPSERDRIAHLLQVYQSTEYFNAQYLPLWAKVTPDAGMRGGLLLVQAREAMHARLMRARLRELGETTFLEVGPERHARDLPFFASPDRSDREKLQVLVHVLEDSAAFFEPITDLIGRIESDDQTRELLRTILDDEYATVKWFMQMHARLAAGSTSA